MKATCPACSGKVIAKCGRLTVWHWAHASKQDCDNWAEGETDWHLSWKNFIDEVSQEMTEVVVGKHRADIRMPSGFVMELQHSTISPAEIDEREAFYQNMAWLFDAIEPFESGRLSVRNKGNYVTFRWKHARKSIAECTADVFLDLGDKLLEIKRIKNMKPFAGWGYLIPKEKFVKKLRHRAVCEYIEHWL